MKKILLFVFLAFAAHIAKSQTYCDSFDVKVTAHPFYDSLLAVHVAIQNPAPQLVSYPTFIIKKGNDTIAVESPDLFAGPMSLHNAVNMPAWRNVNTIGGTISLYSNMWNTHLCDWLLEDVQLCPDSCEEAIVYLGNMGGAWFTGTVNYKLKGQGGQLVKSGVLTITNTNQFDADTVCLYPGVYTLHLSQIALTGGGAKYYGINSGPYSPVYPAPIWNYNSVNDTTFAFDFYKRCTPLGAVQDKMQTSALFQAYVKDGQLKVTGMPGQQLGTVFLYSTDGKVVAHETVRTSTYTKDVRQLPTGIYILKAGQQDRVSAQKIYIGNE